MIAPEDEDLIQRALDGRLTPDESARLRAVLVRDAGAVGLDVRLRATLDALHAAPRPDPPAELVATVMRHIDGANARLTAVGRWRRRASAAILGVRDRSHDRTAQTASLRGRVLWSMAVIAALAVGIGLYTGLPRAGNGTEGAMGLARREASAPASSALAEVERSSVEHFLQGDTFTRAKRNGQVRALLLNPRFRTALSSAEFRTALADPGLSTAWHHPAVRQMLGDPTPRDMVSGDEDPPLDPRLRLALASPVVREALGDRAFGALLLAPTFPSTVADPAFQELLRHPALPAALQHDAFTEALADGPAARP